MPSPDTTMQAYYAARAREYDRVYEKPERQADLRAIEQWLPSLFIGARVLEVACGTGYWTQFIAPVASQVLAVDAAAETLAIARRRVPKSRRLEFLRGLRAVLRPGARVILLDNRYVDGSSSPITSHDADGNTYQTRTLSDGTTHCVLKNFPSEHELRSLLADLGTNITFTTWPHYWALAYEVAARPPLTPA